MKIDPLADYLAALRRSGLLAPERLVQITGWAVAQRADAHGAAKELVRRGWLTDFQARRVWDGRAAELTLGQYLLLEKLGEGGMGEVFKARHRRMERDVALKVIRKEYLANPDAVRRFHREIKAAAQLAHPNVVIAYDADQVGETHFFAMEFVEGRTLAEVVARAGPLPVALACEYARQTALGLQHAFEKGLVHRDIKPTNLLVTERGGVVKILDLGLARLQKRGEDDSSDDSRSSRLTAEGLVVGTPDFLSPEQARDPRSADTRSDLYSLGCTLYYLLTAQVPYPDGSTSEKAYKHLHEPPPSPQLLRADVPDGLAAVLRKLLAKDPQQRYQTPAELARALEPYAKGQTDVPLVEVIGQIQSDEPSTASRFRLPPPTGSEVRKGWQRPRPDDRHGRRLRWAGAAVALAAVGVLVVVLGGPGEPPPGFTNGAGMTMVLLPAGTFVLGPAEGDRPGTKTEIPRPFYLSAHEVTQDQFQQVLGFNPSAHRQWREWKEMPVESVSWADAKAFCDRLNEREPGRLPGWLYRLPTEAEWEYACRAGSSTRYAFGSALLSSQAAFGGDPERGRPSRVGRYSANSWGLFDLHGNVWEWCSDRFDTLGERRVLRGGGWSSTGEDCRSTRRRAEPAEYKGPDAGFRVAFAPLKN